MTKFTSQIQDLSLFSGRGKHGGGGSLGLSLHSSYSMGSWLPVPLHLCVALGNQYLIGSCLRLLPARTLHPDFRSLFQTLVRQPQLWVKPKGTEDRCSYGDRITSLE